MRRVEGPLSRMEVMSHNNLPNPHIQSLMAAFLALCRRGQPHSRLSWAHSLPDRLQLPPLPPPTAAASTRMTQQLPRCHPHPTTSGPCGRVLAGP